MSGNKPAPATSIVLTDSTTLSSNTNPNTAPSMSLSGQSTDRNRHRGGRGQGSNNRNMKGNVFQSHGETNNKQQFMKTVGVLEEYINKTFTYP